MNSKGKSASGHQSRDKSKEERRQLKDKRKERKHERKDGKDGKSQLVNGHRSNSSSTGKDTSPAKVSTSKSPSRRDRPKKKLSIISSSSPSPASSSISDLSSPSPSPPPSPSRKKSKKPKDRSSPPVLNGKISKPKKEKEAERLKWKRYKEEMIKGAMRATREYNVKLQKTPKVSLPKQSSQPSKSKTTKSTSPSKSATGTNCSSPRNNQQDRSSSHLSPNLSSSPAKASVSSSNCKVKSHKATVSSSSSSHRREVSSSSKSSKSRHRHASPSPSESVRNWVPPPPPPGAPLSPRKHRAPQFSKSYLAGLLKEKDEDSESDAVPLWLPERLRDDDSYAKEARHSNARHSAKCHKTCSELTFDDLNAVQFVLERHCIRTETRRVQLRAEKKAFAKFKKNTCVDGKKKIRKKDTYAYFLANFKPPQRSSLLPTNDEATSAACGSGSSSKRGNLTGPDALGLELISRVENKHSTKQGLLLTTLVSSSSLAEFPYLTDKSKRRVAKSTSLLEVVPVPTGDAVYCREMNQNFERMMIDFQYLFGHHMSREEHLHPLEKYRERTQFTDLIEEFFCPRKKEDEELGDSATAGTVTTQRRVTRRNTSIEEDQHPQQQQKTLSRANSNGAGSRSAATSSSNVKRQLHFDSVPSSPTAKSPLRNGGAHFKCARFNGAYLRSPSSPAHASLSNGQSSSVEGSPVGGTPCISPIADSNPPSPESLYHDLVDFTSPKTRRQYKHLHETAKVISKDAEATKRAQAKAAGRRTNNSKQASLPATAPAVTRELSPFEQAYLALDRKLKKNLKSTDDMLQLLDHHVNLFSPYCNCAMLRARGVPVQRPEVKVEPKVESTEESTLTATSNKRRSRKSRNNSGITTGDMAPPPRPPTPPPTPPPIPSSTAPSTSATSTPTTRSSRRRSRAESIDEVAASMSSSAGLSDSKHGALTWFGYECPAKGDPANTKELRDRLGYDESFYTQLPPWALTPEPEWRNGTRPVNGESAAARTHPSSRSEQNSAPTTAPSPPPIRFRDIELLKRRQGSSRFFSALDEGPSILERDPFGLLDMARKHEDVQTTTVLEEARIPPTKKRRLAANWRDRSTDKAEETTAAAGEDGVDDEITRAIALLTGELSKVEEKNDALFESIAHQTAIELDHQEVRITAANHHVDALDDMRVYLQRNCAISTPARSNLLRELDTVLASKAIKSTFDERLQLERNMIDTFNILVVNNDYAWAPTTDDQNQTSAKTGDKQ